MPTCALRRKTKNLHVRDRRATDKSGFDILSCRDGDKAGEHARLD
jgi:hypothetical protein